MSHITPNEAPAVEDRTSVADARRSGSARGAEDRLELRFYDILTVLGATTAVAVNFLALKVTRIGPLTFGGAVVFFPITYILGDVLTEVYGFRRARRVIWLSFGAQLFAAVMSWAVLVMPPAPDRLAIHEHYVAVFGAAPRIFAASLLAFLVGDFVNSIIMARRKVIDRGRAYWKRAILSTVAGQAADSLLFYPLAFAGNWPWQLIGTIMATHYSLKVAIEVLGVPFSYQVVVFLKRAEGVDHYDLATDFNPFGLSVEGDA